MDAKPTARVSQRTTQRGPGKKRTAQRTSTSRRPGGGPGNAPGLRLRPARGSDEEEARRLYAHLGYPRVGRARFRAAWAAALSDPCLRVLVVPRPAGLVALMTLSRRPQPRLAGTLVSIDELVVEPAARGRGIGRRLVAEAVRFARAHAAARLELHTRRSRESFDRGFYARLGFREVDSAVLRLA